MSLFRSACWFCSTLNKQKTIVEVKIQEEGYGTVHAFKEAATWTLCGQEAATGTGDLIAENSFLFKFTEARWTLDTCLL